MSLLRGAALTAPVFFWATMAKTKPRPKPSRFWAVIRKSVKERDLTQLWYGFGQSAVPGVALIEATHKNAGGPIATIWFRWISDGQVDIIFAFVRPGVRRTGVMTWLHEQLRTSYPRADFTTSGGTKFGEPWMRKNGYKQRATGDWVQRPKRIRTPAASVPQGAQGRKRTR